MGSRIAEIIAKYNLCSGDAFPVSLIDFIYGFAQSPVTGTEMKNPTQRPRKGRPLLPTERRKKKGFSIGSKRGEKGLAHGTTLFHRDR
jgi:hypothetical protein